MSSRVTGQVGLRLVEVKLAKLPADLAVRVDKELQKVAPDVSLAIRSEVPTHVPRRNGYAAVLSAAMRFRWVLKAGGKGMTGKVWADGAKDRRQLPGIDMRGVLRHPVFGNRNVWRDQTRGVQRDLVADGLHRAEPLIVRAIEKAAGKAADNVVR
jgi:hypothetical protein